MNDDNPDNYEHGVCPATIGHFLGHTFKRPHTPRLDGFTGTMRWLVVPVSGGDGRIELAVICEACRCLYVPRLKETGP